MATEEEEDGTFLTCYKFPAVKNVSMSRPCQALTDERRPHGHLY